MTHSHTHHRQTVILDPSAVIVLWHLHSCPAGYAGLVGPVPKDGQERGYLPSVAFYRIGCVLYLLLRISNLWCWSEIIYPIFNKRVVSVASTLCVHLAVIVMHKPVKICFEKIWIKVNISCLICRWFAQVRQRTDFMESLENCAS